MPPRSIDTATLLSTAFLTNCNVNGVDSGKSTMYSDGGTLRVIYIHICIYMYIIIYTIYIYISNKRANWVNGSDNYVVVLSGAKQLAAGCCCRFWLYWRTIFACRPENKRQEKIKIMNSVLRIGYFIFDKKQNAAVVVFLKTRAIFPR